MPEPKFRDAGTDVVVELPVSCGTTAQDVRVSGGADALAIRTGDAEAPLLSVLQLYSTVEPAATRIEVPADGSVQVTLRKLDPDLPWPSLHAQDAPQASGRPRGAVDAASAAISTAHLPFRASSGTRPPCDVA